MERRRVTEAETKRLLESAEGCHVRLTFGSGGVWLEPVESNAWAFDLLGESIPDRLEKVAKYLRAEGAIFGHERDLMIDAANLLRDEDSQ
jgi:hypothetical protein